MQVNAQGLFGKKIHLKFFLCRKKWIIPGFKAIETSNVYD